MPPQRAKYLHNRQNTYHLSPKKWQEKKNIQQIIANNGYRTSTREDTPRREKQSQNKNKDKPVTLWAKFMYNGKEMRAITKALKNNSLKIAYSTNTTIRKLSSAKQQFF
jgi:hypothetical protein